MNFLGHNFFRETCITYHGSIFVYLIESNLKEAVKFKVQSSKINQYWNNFSYLDF